MNYRDVKPQSSNSLTRTRRSAAESLFKSAGDSIFSKNMQKPPDDAGEKDAPPRR